MNQTPPSFDAWTVVFFVSAIQGLFVAFMLWRWQRGNATANRLLAVLLALFSITMLEYVAYWTRHIYYWPHLIDLTAQWPYVMGPLVLLYLENIFEKKGLSARDFWHFLPFLLALAVFSPWLLSSAEFKQQHMTGQVVFPISRPVLQALIWLRIASLLAYAGWSFYYVWQQPRAGRSRSWGVTISLCFAGFALAYLSYFVLVRFAFFNLQWDYHISLMMSLFIWVIAWAGYTQPDVFDGLGWPAPAIAVKYRNSGLSAEASKSLMLRLEELMRQKQIHRDPDISLEKLADMLHASRHHVSQVINEQQGMSFFEFVNHWRIEEARRILSETTRQDFHVIEVAYATGFNNKVSFNNAFKKATGMTPTEYRNQYAKTPVEMVR
ncbi:MAG: helix-turn-helix transcriptional regulator [Saprospiraceae bacterium]|nr:helix-turn-helix transcriptional regulator [Saprospiraceae bacterium]